MVKIHRAAGFAGNPERDLKAVARKTRILLDEEARALRRDGNEAILPGAVAAASVFGFLTLWQLGDLSDFKAKVAYAASGTVLTAVTYAYKRFLSPRRRDAGTLAVALAAAVLTDNPEAFERAFYRVIEELNDM